MCEKWQVSRKKRRTLIRAINLPCCIKTMCCCLCPDFSPCWFAALKQLPPAHSSAAQSSTLIFFQDFIFFAGKQVLSGRDTHRCTVHVFALFIPLCIAPYKSYLGKQQSIYVCGTSFPFYLIYLWYTPKTHSQFWLYQINQLFYQKHQMPLRAFF